MNARRFDPLIGRVRSVSGQLPDGRTGDNTRFELADIGLSAFAVYFTQCPSFLSFEQNMEIAQGRNNARSLFQVGRIPCDKRLKTRFGTRRRFGHPRIPVSEPGLNDTRIFTIV